MKKLFLALFSLVFLASAPTVHAATDLTYTGFDSSIEINQDTSITVTETVKVDYLTPHHGIFRYVPETKLKVLSVKDETGNKYKYKVSGGSVKEIKIGDPDVTITGEHVYVISYQVKGMIKEFSDHYELYWNVTGSDWDGELPKPTASVSSTFANVTKVGCYAGTVGESAQDCTGSFKANLATFESLVDTGQGTDFTIVVGLDKNNSFIFPSTAQKILDFIVENWFYAVTPLPFLIPFYFWMKKGRDQRYISDNIYYEPESKGSRTVGVFERKFIPLVYSPIKGLTPAQIGTIIDQKVDIADVVAEITELARLGYLKIKKIPKKGIFSKVDYEFTSLGKEQNSLQDYQKTILKGLFEAGDVVLLSSLKNKFYVDLKEIKDQLYENMKEKGFFDGNPEKVRGVWLGVVFATGFAAFVLVSIFGGENSFLAFFIIVVSGILGIILARSMPRRTPHGYALYRQTEGLKWYVNKGAWRQEIAEKKLFIDEMVPLAISLGVIGKLASDMKDLGMEPPKYIGGVNTGTFASDIGSFQSSAGGTLSSAPSSSGSSGFSGGSSGGGGGGGGGGGW